MASSLQPSPTEEGWVMVVDIKVQDLMSPEVLTLDEDESILLAEDIMHLGRLRHLPVVRGPDRRVVGIVTHRDILRASISSISGFNRSEDEMIKETFPVREVMRRDVRTVTPETSASEACRTLLDHKYGCLPVVSDKGTLVGIVTEADFVGFAYRILQGLSQDGSDAPSLG